MNRLFSLFFLTLMICTSLQAHEPCSIEANAPLWVDTGQVTLWTESMGSLSDRPAILLIAGLGSSGRFWPDCFCQELVAAGYFVIRFDNRQVALSSPSPKKFNLCDLADDVVAILDAYHLPSAHIIGISMGGMIAQFTAINYPSRVQTLNLLSTAPVAATPCLDMPMTFPELVTVSNTLYFLATNRPAKDYMNGLSTWLKIFRYFNGDYPLDIDLASTYAWDLYHYNLYSTANDINNVHLKNIQHMMSSLNNRRGLLQSISAPTLIVHGTMDPLILLSRGGKALHEAIPGSTLKIYPKMGHGCFNKELLHELAEDILGFIKINS